MRDVYIAGVGMTAFGKFQDSTLRDLASEAVAAALRDADLTGDSVEVAFFANAAEGLLSGQEMIVGQVALRDSGLSGIPIVNVENACASGSTAVHLAWLAVASGQVEWALAVGAEKLTHQDKKRPLVAMASGVDLGRLDLLRQELYGAEGPPPGERSFFMDLYADLARRYMQATGATVADYAAVAVKSHHHGSLNPRAQYRDEVTVEEVLASRVISSPLTLLMCSPIGDGAAAVLLCSRESAERREAPPVRIAGSALVSGRTGLRAGPTSVERASRRAYEQASLGPSDLDLVELHDAAAPAELWLYEELGLCAPGEGAALLRSGASTLGGRLPVNTSGGLLSKGHPIGASGCAQIVELTEQLRGRAGQRQVPEARVALAENNGGWLGPDPAATCVTILCRM